MKSICIVQARTKSTRLPNKTLLPLNGHTVIEEVLLRCKFIRTDDLVCAIPFSDADSELEFLASRHAKIAYGPEDDVLSRYLLASKGFDIIMRITSDCPLLSPALCNAILVQSATYDYASNVEPRTFPKGLDCEVFTRAALEIADGRTPPAERVHVTPYLRKGPFRRFNFENPWPMDGRLTLDTPDDYAVIKQAFLDKESPL